MDAISDPTFFHSKLKHQVSEETPSLLTVILDTNPSVWGFENEESNLLEALKSVIVFLNAHLAFNSANQVAVIAAYSNGVKYLFPRDKTKVSETSNGKDIKTKLNIIDSKMYTQFRKVDEAVLEELYNLFEMEQKLYTDMKNNDNKDSNTKFVKSSLAGALSSSLTYVNRILKENLNLKSRILIVSSGSKNERQSEVFQYIPIMNCIFTASKLKCPIDVVKIGGNPQATFLQQATDATNGVYLHVESTKGLIQYLSTAMFIDPTLRRIIVKPNQGIVDFRTSCFLTGKVVAIGFVCSVCLCVLSVIPSGNRCPACDCEFDEKIIKKMKRKPIGKNGNGGVSTNRINKQAKK
ncbi:probable RNA polymerase II transcription factor B subunit 4 [Saccharomycodes ludwigii]|uniref:General transcription and DNA repair factor IIH subunit TFB4 n=1 Tax=Saccharomycodes ludwigii TaxID=36035 RepID=A0A376B741_9ASCO|nr:hypothetical protein SCDLUD_000713 [Saccharomycodes ludwigii]KAH3903101.1 hypothetical protein SCDLUD_000713 [Saccharomycodes ludwigii]SSD59910.1 probable RNA polymerase II transcription factor B subunit 4 [Saccharomycodes ludwigii]